jgi:hypothetical protein
VLKIQVAAGTNFRGSRVAKEKFVYSMTSTFNAETPCKASRNINANPKSNDARHSSRAFPSAAETYVEFRFALEGPFRAGIGLNDSYTRRRIGCRTSKTAR